MNLVRIRSLPLGKQYAASIAWVMMAAMLCYLASGFTGYRVIALVLVLNISVIASLFDIWPVLVSACISALIWNFFFIPPRFTFHISNPEDLLMFLLYFAIALINAVLTSRIRSAETRARDKEEKDKAIKLYNTVLNSLSHELRTPIATIIGAVDNLIENQENISPANRYDLLLQIEDGGMRLNRQVENLLNMSRLESGMLKPRLDWCDLNELVNTIIQKKSPDDKQRIVFVPDEQLPLFKTDAGLVIQVLQNLLHNALAYTKGAIGIYVTQDYDSLTIKISDEGPGIPAAYAKEVFEKFYRLPDSKPGGSGLGLSIIKGYIETLGGVIHLYPNHPDGSTFVVAIPAATSYLNSLKNE